MPKFEVEIDDKGEFVGTLPTEMTTVLDKLKTSAHGEGYGKGAQKAAEEAKAQIEAAIKAEKAKLEATMPLEKAKWDDIDAQNKLLKGQIETTVAEHRKRMTELSESHATELTQRMAALQARDAKIRTLVNGQLRALAAQAGARDESLPELEVILQHRIGYDDNMEPFVLAEDGKSKATTAAGNPLGIDVFVKQYLENHQHHRKPAPGRGGDARGGASLRAASLTTSATAARERVESGDRSVEAISDLFHATRKQPAA